MKSSPETIAIKPSLAQQHLISSGFPEKESFTFFGANFWLNLIWHLTNNNAEVIKIIEFYFS